MRKTRFPLRRLSFLIVAAIAGGLGGPWVQAAPVPVDFITAHVDSEKSVTAVYPAWVSLGVGLGSDPLLMRAGFVNAGWQWTWLGVDAKFGLGSMSYSMIGVAPDPTVTDTSTSAGDPSAERARPRNGSDPWTYILGEVGVSARGRLFASSLPRFSQRARFAMGGGLMNDQINSLTFTAITFSFEGDVEYQLGVGSRFGVRGGIIYNAGVLDSESDPDPTHGRLPASWIQEQFSLVYYLR